MRFTNSWIIQTVQINQPLLRQNYLPYSVGLLQAYAQKHAKNPGHYTFLPPLFERKRLELMLPLFQFVDVVAISTYVWNFQYSMALAKNIKRLKPDVLIVAGGPQIPDQASQFLLENPWIDLCVHGEGEKVFLQVLENLNTRDWSGIPGISFLNSSNQFETHPPLPREKNLERFPSPYLTHVFDSLLRSNPWQEWVALWETNRGCPFSCSFCDWGSATQNKVNSFDLERLEKEIAWFSKNKIQLVYCCDANFGILPRDIHISEKMVEYFKTTRYPKSFYVQNTKNATDRAFNIQKILCKSGLSQIVTLSLQSISQQALQEVRRENISLQTYRDLQIRFRKEGIATYTDLLIGLPGETYASFAKGISQVIEEGQHHQIRFYPVYLLPNAPISAPESVQKYALETVTQPYLAPFSSIDASEVIEKQTMLIACHSYTRDDWVKMRVLAWLYEILYFNRKLLQIPLLLMHGLCQLSFFDMLEAYLKEPHSSLISDLIQFLFHKANAIQGGETELCQGPISPGIRGWLSVEDFVITGITQSKAWDLFFQEHQRWAINLFKQRNIPTQHLNWLNQAFALAKMHFTMQISSSSSKFRQDYNLWQIYQGLLHAQNIALEEKPSWLEKSKKGPPFQFVLSAQEL